MELVTAPAAALTLRRARPDDAAACGAICFEAFAAIADRHGFARDFPSPEAATGLLTHMFGHPCCYGVVAEVDGRTVGSNVLTEADAIAGVGPITIAPDAQDGRVGRRLMEAVLDRAAERRVAGVRLCQAAYHGRSLALYTSLGFRVREPLAVMQGPAVGRVPKGYAVRAATPDDRAACDDLCRRVHGHDRTGELAEAIGQGTARVVHRAGRLVGYTTGVGFMGHSVGTHDEALMALVGAADAFPGPGFLLPTRQATLFRWCLAHRLRVVFPATLMSVGLYGEPAGPFLPSILY
ncbi:GNAT family N-acetyltransferase [Rubrivirga marina]|uniref:GNAT family N-acetyltransferase n=1 Tax=Rubrivirga marina TaxID=1196024 RepID=A0A271J1Y1_9BACT|nr:GNAT family N-acetyltransferase [Rubrivirga marina]PAP77268.1 GNAT family N-acetyltransferase [Rubrivirga marina]